MIFRIKIPKFMFTLIFAIAAMFSPALTSQSYADFPEFQDFPEWQDGPGGPGWPDDGWCQRNVILLTLDGVRWQEVFSGTDPILDGNRPPRTIFENLLGELSLTGLLMGDLNKGDLLTVSNTTNLGMPAYQSIFAGKTQPCMDSTCGRITVETVGERIVRQLNLPETQVATIASWKLFPEAVEHIEGATFTNGGNVVLDDGTNDPEFARISQLALDNPPLWNDSRADKYTFALSLHYLKKHYPRFLTISLKDSDEWGHRGEYKNYVETLRHYDSMILELINTLKTMGDYGRRTTLIVTTDHGRGKGDLWSQHGPQIQDSKNVWIYGWKGDRVVHAPANKKFEYDHLDIRPTIETNVCLRPIQCNTCGEVIPELVP